MMKPEKLKRKFDELADTLMNVIQEFKGLEPEVKYAMDKKALSEMISNLYWATENSTVIGLHQLGQALDDNMGTGLNEKPNA